jgi:hypothetical protein
MQEKESVALAQKLSEISVKSFYSPYENLAFPETMDKIQWFTSPELISIYGSKAYEALSEEKKKLLSFYEAVNFYSLNIHGEKALMEGLARRLHDQEHDAHTRYIHHFLDEENKHMVYFGTFCTRYAGKVYADRKFQFPREYATGEEELLFFLKVMIFEEIVDHYNKSMSTDQRLNEVARKINLFHHKDEIRHLIYGRQRVKELFQEHSPKWSQKTLDDLRTYIQSYFVTTWREYYNPDIYKDVDIENAYDLAEEVFHSEAAKLHRERVSKHCVDYLMECGILVERPNL